MFLEQSERASSAQDALPFIDGDVLLAQRPTANKRWGQSLSPGLWVCKSWALNHLTSLPQGRKQGAGDSATPESQ